MLIQINLDKSNFSKANELLTKLDIVCKDFCSKKKEIKKSLQNLEAKNEKKHDFWGSQKTSRFLDGCFMVFWMVFSCVSNDLSCSMSLLFRACFLEFVFKFSLLFSKLREP